MTNHQLPTPRWYQGVSAYQWMVLSVASLGWIFDVFEGQLFVASMREAMPALLGLAADDPLVVRWNDWAFGSFLLGGALGGVLFGRMSDRIGRARTMVFTILFYSLFTCVTALAQAPWQMVALRFFVAMGVGGEWAVASAMVAEVMPQRSRPVMSSLFHASSVVGVVLAAATGAYVVGNPALGETAWRWGFAIGALPALLSVWVRWKLREPEAWLAARERADSAQPQAVGRLGELFQPPHLRNTLVAVSLSSIGLVTFWGAHIYGKNALLRHAQQKALATENVPAEAPPAVYQAVWKKHQSSIKRAEMLSMALNSIGAGLGLALFGTISNRLGRKGAFVLYHVAAFAMVLVLFRGLIAHQAGPVWLAITLPVFGFFTVGIDRVHGPCLAGDHAARVRFLHGGHARGLCGLFSGTVPHAAAGQWRGVLLQHGAVGDGCRLFLFWYDFDHPRGEGRSAGAALSVGRRGGPVRPRNTRRSAARLKRQWQGPDS